MADLARNVDAYLRVHQEGDPRVFDRTAKDVRELGKAAHQTGAQTRESAHDVDRLEDQVRALEKALQAARRDLEAFKRSGRGVDQLRSSFAGLRGVIASLSVGSLFLLLKQGLQEVIEVSEVQTKALAQLDAALESTGGAAGMTAEELIKIAAGLQEVTTYGDETIEQVEAVLLTFTNLSREVLPETIERVLDLAARFGTDLKSGALQLGKALNDPVANLGALSRAGIQFSQDQKTLIKSLVEAGDLLGAQKIILKELETQFGGSARAARDTFGGALEAASNTAGDLLEKIGEGGLSFALRNVAEDFIAAGQSGDESFRAIGQVLGTIITLISGLVKATKAGMTTIAGTVAMALAGIARSVVDLLDLLDNMPGLGSLTEGLDLDLTREAINDFARGVAADTTASLQSSRDGLETELDRLVKLWSDYGNTAASGVAVVKSAVDDIDPSSLGELEEATAALVRQFREASGQLADQPLAENFEAQAQALIEQYRSLGAAIPAELEKIANATAQKAAAIREQILKMKVDDFRLLEPQQQEAVREEFMGLVEALKDANGAIDTEVMAIGNTIGALVAPWEPVREAAKQTIVEVTDGLGGISIVGKQVGQDLAGVGEAATEAGPKFELAGKAAAAGAGEFESAAAAMAESAKAMQPAADGPRDVAAEVEKLVQAMRDARSEGDQAAGGLREMAAGAAEAGPKIQEGAEAAGEAARGFAAAAEDVGHGTEALSEQAGAAAEAGQELGGARDAADELAEAEKGAQASVKDLTTELTEAAGSIKTLTTDLGSAGQAIKEAFAGFADLTGPLNGSLQTTLELVRSLARETKELVANLQRVGNPMG